MNIPCDVIEIKSDYCVCIKGTIADGYKIEWQEESQSFVPAPLLPFADGATVTFNTVNYIFDSATQRFEVVP